MYNEGEKYRVMKDGARLEGFLLHGEELVSGWSRSLKRGEVLECKGWHTINVGSVVVRGVQWKGAKVPESAVSVQVWPFDGLFRPFPIAGLLEPATIEAVNQAEINASIDEGHEVDLTRYYATPAAISSELDEVVDLRG